MIVLKILMIPTHARGCPVCGYDMIQGKNLIYRVLDKANVYVHQKCGVYLILVLLLTLRPAESQSDYPWL